MFATASGDLGQEGLVLVIVLLAARTQVLAVVVRIGRRPGDGVELVIAHDGLRSAGVDHVSDDLQGSELPRSPVDQVTDEHYGSRRMPPRPAALTVPHLLEQGFQSFSVAVNVADYVKGQTG